MVGRIKHMRNVQCDPFQNENMQLPCMIFLFYIPALFKTDPFFYFTLRIIKQNWNGLTLHIFQPCPHLPCLLLLTVSLWQHPPPSKFPEFTKNFLTQRPLLLQLALLGTDFLLSVTSWETSTLTPNLCEKSPIVFSLRMQHTLRSCGLSVCIYLRKRQPHVTFKGARARLLGFKPFPTVWSWAGYFNVLGPQFPHL